MADGAERRIEGRLQDGVIARLWKLPVKVVLMVCLPYLSVQVTSTIIPS
jgi:hypothetical protein